MIGKIQIENTMLGSWFKHYKNLEHNFYWVWT